MPKTKFQILIFTIIMAAVMVYAMSVYNIAISMGRLQNETFLIALVSFPLQYLQGFLCAYFIGSRIAMCFAFKLVNPKLDKPIVVTLAIQVCTVCVMVPLMSFIATLEHYGFATNFIPQYLTIVCQNFIFALPLQIFIAGPLVRFIFSNIFAPKKSAIENQRISEV